MKKLRVGGAKKAESGSVWITKKLTLKIKLVTLGREKTEICTNRLGS